MIDDRPSLHLSSWRVHSIATRSYHTWAQLQHGNRLSNRCFGGSFFKNGFTVPPAGSGDDFLNDQLWYGVEKER